MNLGIKTWRRWAIVVMLTVAFFLIGLLRAVGVLAATWQDVLDAKASYATQYSSCVIWLKNPSAKHFEIYKRCNQTLVYQTDRYCVGGSSLTDGCESCKGDFFSCDGGGGIQWNVHVSTYYFQVPNVDRSQKCDGTHTDGSPYGNACSFGGHSLNTLSGNCFVGVVNTDYSICTNNDVLLSSYDVTDSCTANMTYNSSGGVYGYIAQDCTCTPDGFQYTNRMPGYCGNGSASSNPWFDYNSGVCQNYMCVYTNVIGAPTGHDSGTPGNDGGGHGTNPGGGGGSSGNVATGQTNTITTGQTGSNTTTTATTGGGSGISTAQTSSGGTTTTTSIVTYPSETAPSSYGSSLLGAQKSQLDFQNLMSSFTTSMAATSLFSSFHLTQMLPSTGSAVITVNLGNTWGTYSVDLSAGMNAQILGYIGAIMLIAAGVVGIRIITLKR